MADWVTLGVALRARGLKGEVVVEPFGAQAERFRIAKRVFLAEGDRVVREAAVEQAWDHQREVIVKLEGVDDRDAADAIRNWELRIPMSERLPLGEDEFYHSDLIGCEVIDHGVLIGPVKNVVDYGAGPLLDVDDRGRELLIPFVKGIWKVVDLAARRIEMELPEGLREI